MKRLLTLAITCFYFISLQAQTPTLEWVQSAGNSLWDSGENILIDDNDDIIVAGFFSDTVDFDSGSGVLELGTASTTTNNPVQNINGFVQKLDADGQLIWAIKNLSGDYTTDNSLALSYTQEMATDDQGNIYIVVPCNNTIDLDPGPNTFTLPMTGDGFALQKLDTNGSFLWALELAAEASKIHIDHNNDIILSGIFLGNLDFDPGAGVFNMYAAYESGVWIHEPFICKLAGSDGSFIWARQFDATTEEGCIITGLGTDSSGNIHIGGAFKGNFNLSYPATTTILNSQNTTTTDGYYVKLSGSTGEVFTYKEYKGFTNYHVRDLDLDAADNLYVAGDLIGDAVHKYNPAGIEQWDVIIGTYKFNIDIDVTDNGTVFISDDFHGTNKDLDPGPNSFLVTSVDTWTNDVIIQLDTNGDFVWAQNTEHIFDTFSEGRFFIQGSNTGDLYITGTYQGTVDFDYGPGVSEQTSVPCSISACQDIFIQKIGTVCPIGYDTTMISTCGIYQSSNDLYDVPGMYMIADTIYDACGIDSILITELILYPIYNIIDTIDVCEGVSYTLSNGTIITDFPTGPSFPDAHTSVAGCDSIIYLEFIVHPHDTIIVSDTICYNSDFTAPNGTSYMGLTEGLIDTSYLTSMYDCDSVVITDLMVYPNSSSFSPQQVCEGDDYTFADGTTVTNLTSFILHPSILTNENGCDSTVVEILNVGSLFNVEGNTWICEHPYQKHIYVDDTATGNNDGTSWNDAFTDFQDALALATLAPDYQIHVAEGIYYPTSDTQRGIAFELPEFTTILGGYPDNGGTRDPAANETILSGNIDGLPTKDGDSYHVVSIKDVTWVTMDGFTIRDGNADQANSFGRSRGGGVYVKGSSTIIFEQCDIKWNRAIYGGGMFLTLSPAVQVNRTEMKNNRADYGSAIFHSNETQLYLEGTRITNNTSDIRAAIEVNNSSHTRLINTIIANNVTANSNAISFVATNRDQTCDIHNSTITGEEKNKSLISMLIGFGDQLDINIYNSIIAHQNASFDKGFVAYQNGVLNLHTDHCYLQGTSVLGTSNGNLYTGTDGALVLNNDYSLPSNSLGIDAGDDSLVIPYYSTDINGENRISGTAVDMGAFEYVTTSSKEAYEASENPLSKLSTQIFPNPVSDELNIQFQGQEEVWIQANFYNINGQLIQQQEGQISSHENIKMDVSLLPSGIYFLHIHVDDSRYIERVVIQAN